MTDQSPALTKNQHLVLEVLSRAKAPMSAYSILDELRGAGLRAPLQVYRALEKLIEHGLVHRLESVNAFVVCSHSHPHDADILSFAICTSCDAVIEITDKQLGKRIASITKENGFKPAQTMVEIRGLCAACGGG